MNTKNPQPSRNFSCISSLKRQFSFFSLCAPALGMYLAFFSPTNTKLQVSSDLFALCQAPRKPCGPRSSAMCLSFEQELLCFHFSHSTETFVHCVCVCVFSSRKNSGSPPISMKFHKRDFPFCSAGCSPQKFEWCHHFEGASLFLGPYSEKCPSSLVSQGLLLHILSWVLFPLVKMAILNNRIPYPAHADTCKP